jgi:hypothetical protein
MSYRLLALSLAAVLGVAACGDVTVPLDEGSSEGIPSPAAAATVASVSPTGELKVLTPTSGEVVSAATVTFAGTAPIGARVVRDISLAPDDEVIATDGTWTLDVELDEGVNEVVLRLGDDDSTAQTFSITYRPVAAAATPSATPEVTAEPTPEATPEPTPAPAFATVEDGTWEVGSEIRAGTYRLREPAGFCYWARLKGFDGSLSEIIANDNVIDAYAVVTIGKKDAGFESNGCGEWTKDLSRVTEGRSRIDADGTYIVGTDIKPGKWKSSGGEFCYWARLKGFGGTLGSIIANDNVFGGRTTVTIRSKDKGFQTKGCGTWVRK